MKSEKVFIPCPLPERRIYQDEMAITYCAGKCKYYTSCDPAQKVQKNVAKKK